MFTICSLPEIIIIVTIDHLQIIVIFTPSSSGLVSDPAHLRSEGLVVERHLNVGFFSFLWGNRWCKCFLWDQQMLVKNIHVSPLPISLVISPSLSLCHCDLLMVEPSHHLLDLSSDLGVVATQLLKLLLFCRQL